jgi:hypothetical protein
MRQAVGVARFRFRATFRRRWAGYLAITLLIGLLGGLAMGAAAGARRTQSAYPAFLRSTNPSNLIVPTAVYGLTSTKTGYDPAILRKLARLPHVERVATSGGLNAALLRANGTELPPPADAPANLELSTDASISGLYVDTDRVAISAGRMLDPSRANEFVVSAPVAKLLGLHVGSVLHFGFYTNAEEAAPGPSGDQYRPHPHLRMDLTLVGIGEHNNAVVQDDVDAVGSNFALFSPALGRRLAACCVLSTDAALVLDHGNRSVPAVEAELRHLNPLLASHVYVPSIDEAKAERAIEPESIALGVFGLIAALATLLIAGQLIARQLRAGSDELDVLRALGARPATTTFDGLVGVLMAIVAGAVLAAVVAIAVSPIAPIGAVRRVYPSRGIAFDWSVLGFGALTLAVLLAAIAVVLAVRTEPSRAARRAQRAVPPRSRTVGGSVGARLPVPAATGVRFALDRGRGRAAVPARSAILGAVLALVVVVSTLTFGASLHTLVSRPALYGWNWDYELSGGGGVGNIPQQQSARALAHDPDIAAWSDAYFGEAQVDGITVPAFGGNTDPRVAPPLLSGHGIERRDQIVLGANTLAQLHRHLGDTVTATIGSRPARLTIVGTATLPAIGGSGGGSLHLEMGTGALFAYQNIPPPLRDVAGNTPTGPQAILVRFRPGANLVHARRGLDAIAQELSLPTNWGVTVTSVQRPAEIVNYRSMSSTPLYLGVALAAGAVVALALTLVTSVRRRRHDLALLKTFGFTRRQLAGVVAWQSTVAVGIGTLIGIPLGIAIGRELWDLFARQIHVVPEPTVPVVAIALVGIGALILANLVAAIPGRQAAKTETAVLLRAD